MIRAMMAADKHKITTGARAGEALRTVVDRVEQVLERAPLAFGHGTDNARDEAVWLVLAALDRSPVEARVDPAEPLDSDAIASIDALLARRIAECRPLAYLTGKAWFAGLAFRCDERALVPRSPLAEPILERFEPWIGARPAARILDLGTGNGCIALACAHAFPEAAVDATDVDGAALALARENIADHGMGDRLALYQGDLFAPLPSGRRYDLIVSNPPYVDAEAMAGLPAEYAREPAHALSGGSDGLAYVERILEQAPQWLRPGGLLVVEAGRAGATLVRRHRQLALVGLAFERGGGGVFAITREDLVATAPAG